MNQLMLSSNLNVIESEIKMYKESMGRSIWEIGRRLNHVKEQDLMHGEFIDWLNTVGIERRKASRMMRIAKELPENETTLSHLGLSALDLIASLPEDTRTTPHLLSNGDVKTPIDMTVKELKEVKNNESHVTKGGNMRPPNTKESAVSTEPPVQREQDKLRIETLEHELTSIQARFNQINKQYEDVLLREVESKEKADQLDQLKNHINYNKSELGKIESQVASTLNLTEFKREVDTLLIKISPLRYQLDFHLVEGNINYRQQYTDIVNVVNDWCQDMHSLLNQPAIIEAEYTEY